jgi:two-component system NtrC family sensor kinase
LAVGVQDAMFGENEGTATCLSQIESRLIVANSPTHPDRMTSGTTRIPLRLTLLALITAAVLAFAGINFRQQLVYRAPTDGAVWVPLATPITSGSGAVLVARSVAEHGPAWAAGIRRGDLLAAVDQRPLSNPEDVTRALYRAGNGGRVQYTVLADGLLRPVVIRVGGALPPLRLYAYQGLIGLLYLVIGGFVLARGALSSKALHVYAFCLSSFVLYTFHYTGKLNGFDQIVYWSNVAATLLTGALLLHLAMTFPERKWVLAHVPAAAVLLYAPAACALLLRAAWARGALTFAAPGATIVGVLDRLDYAVLGGYFVASAVAFVYTQRHAQSPVLRHQMKWISRGTVLGASPFLLLYVLPFVFGSDPPRWAAASTASLIFIPLTFGYAIARYRLMDVDAIFRRGMAYTLATLAIVAISFAIIGGAASLIHSRIAGGNASLVLVIVITALLFQPIQGYIQERIERFFYRERYGFRRSLTEFGREINAELDLDMMLQLLVERLAKTLAVARVAVFLSRDQDAASGDFHLARSWGIAEPGGLDLGFLDRNLPEFASGRLFVENPAHPATLPQRYCDTIARLELTCYIACEVKGRTVAVIGIGRTHDGDFVSSEDMELLESLAGYLAVAVDNARLYRSLSQKVREYERLKDFSENMVESIRVGVAAVDLNDRIESWNAQMEVLSARPRSQAISRGIAEVFAPELAAEYERARREGGIHTARVRVEFTPGEPRTLQVSIAPLVTRNFDLVGTILLLDDITAQTELQEKLAQSERLSSIGLLAAGVAHEVNTPLAVISNYTQLLAKQLASGDPTSNVVQKITEQTFRASEIVNSLLNFSRTGGAEMALVNLNRVVRDTLALVEHPLRRAGVRVETVLDPDLPEINGHLGKLQQVLLNLVFNARDAMPGGGLLRVRTASDDGHVTIRVEDNGEGIAPEVRHRIFDPFFTTRKSVRRGGSALGSAEAWGSGTGLGLAITYGIVQEHRGHISVESSRGRGTSFQLEFPKDRKVAHV